MAAQAEEIKKLKERLDAHEGPVLSVYLSVNPRYNTNQGQAYKIRLKDAFKGIEDLPEEVASPVREDVEGGTPPPGARTLVFFVAADGLFERYALQVDLPEVVRFGDPHVAPLVLAVDEHEPYGVAIVEAEEFRFFVSTPPVIPEEDRGETVGSGFFREVDLKPTGMYPVSGGSSDMDPAGRKQDANLHRFYKQAGEVTQKVVFGDNVRRLIIAGTKERTSPFREALPQQVQDRVVAEEHLATGAALGEIFERIEGVVEHVEREEEAELLNAARENGVRGIKDTVEALQEGRVYQILALWGLDAEIRWCDHDELAITEVAREECPYCGRETRVRPLNDVLVDLAAARDARVEYFVAHNEVAATPNEDIEKERVPDEPADVLRQEFEGLAGLLRY
ncbi:hypothetical protein GBA65_01325 [Rubrobacter marinus]|uniref:Peptide chain release factor subunit 1 n=1 Tax=Rubrobacter marinus TaxID=2653852 RepID=A0A6G8PSS0_9ACTN|nr:hypothetical protein [Rubrobacter marinus]QIN77373.1 hypothetical protein GBA65_01325 [Rubrobacter marinus]